MTLVITQSDNGSQAADQQVYTDAAVDVTPGGAERGFIIDVGARNTTGITGVKVDGVSATPVLVAVRTDTGTNVTGKFTIAASLLPDPTVSDVDIETTYASTAARHAFSIQTITGHASLTPFHSVKAEIAANNVAGPVDVPLPLNVPAGGGISCCACAADNNTAGTSFGWTNATERTDFQVTGENFRMSTAADVGLSAETARAVNARFTGSAGIFSPVGVAASFEALVDGALASAGSAAAAFQGSAIAEGSFSMVASATVDFRADGTFEAAGIATAAFVGSVTVDGAFSMPGVADAAFVGAVEEGIFTMTAGATCSFSSILPVDGDFTMAASCEVSFLGELTTRWTSVGAITNSWTSEGVEP